MKKLLSLLMVVLMAFALVGCGGTETATEDEGSDVVQADIVLVTDAKSVDDKGFNEYSWRGVVDYADAHGITKNYYMPTEQTTEQYLAQMASAVAGGAKIIVCPGYLFEEAVGEAQEMYPDVKFICIDFTPAGGAAENSLGVVFEEEESGFLAGYAAVKDGFRKLGFDGAMPVPAVKNFGYGYLAGAEYAAEELGLAAGEVTVEYSYTGEFAEKPEYVTADQALYAAGTEVIFGCGSPRNAFEACDKFNATAETPVWAIGVDSDCSDQCEKCLTSALKNLTPVVSAIISTIYDGTFEGGKTNTYCVKDEALALPMATSQFTTFSQADYDAIYAKLNSDEAFRTSLPTGYGNGEANDFVEAADYVATLKLVKVNLH